MTLTDTGHQVTSHPTTDTGNEAHFHKDTPDQVKSFPELMKYPGKSYDYTGQQATSFPKTGLSNNASASGPLCKHRQPNYLAPLCVK